MTNKNKIILVSSSVIILGAILVAKWLKNRTISGVDSPEEASVDTINTEQESAIKKLTNVSSFPLKRGSIGLEVKYLQNWLNKNNYVTIKLTEDGNFGALTENAVVNMQKNPRFKEIIEYKNNEAFSDPTVSGIISRNFYDFFIVRTRKYTKEQTGFNYN